MTSHGIQHIALTDYVRTLQLDSYMSYIINPFWPGDAIGHHRIQSSWLVQVVAFHLFLVPINYLLQYMAYCQFSPL